MGKMFARGLLLAFVWLGAAQAAEPTTLVKIVRANPELPPEAASNKFIVPNEFDNYLQYYRLPASNPGEKTAAISVGTLRAFNLLGATRRDALIALDYADGVPPFNENLARLVAGRSRTEFLAGLIGVDPKKFDLSTREGVLAALSEQFQSRVWPETKDPLLGKLYAALPPPRSGFNSLRYDWLSALKVYASEEEKWKATFFSSEGAYQHVQKVIRSGNFHAVRGSLSGDKAMKQVGDFLKAEKMVVADLDLSNAVEHIARYEGKDGLERFERNLRALPVTGKTRVLLTVEGMVALPGQLRGEAQVGQWHYLVRNVPETLESLKGASSPRTWAVGLDRTNRSCSVAFGRL